MKLKRLYELNNSPCNKKYIEEKELLEYPNQPKFNEYVSMIYIIFYKIYDLPTKISIEINSTAVEETIFLRKGPCIYRMCNFRNVAYPYNEYPTIKIKFDGGEIPVKYAACYRSHEYELFIKLAIKIYGTYTSLNHYSYKYIKFIDKAYLITEKNYKYLARPTPIISSDMVALECDYFDLITENDKYKYLRKLINPPITGMHSNTLLIHNLVNPKYMDCGYTILVKSNMADILIKQLSEDFVKYKIKKVIKSSYDDYGISYDMVKALVKYLYKKKIYEKKKERKRKAKIQASKNNSNSVSRNTGGNTNGDKTGNMTSAQIGNINDHHNMRNSTSHLYQSRIYSTSANEKLIQKNNIYGLDLSNYF